MANAAWCFITSPVATILPRPYLHNVEEIIWMKTTQPPTFSIRKSSVLPFGWKGEVKVLAIKQLADGPVQIKRKGKLEVIVDSQVLGDANSNQVITNKAEVEIKVDGHALTLIHCKGGLSIPEHVFDEYDLKSEIVETGLSRLYKIQDRTSDEMCVLKVKSKKKKTGLMVEISILENISHHNIIKFVVAGPLNEYLIIEHADGGDLEQYLCRHSDITEQDGKLVFKQVISAVRYLHRNEIAHRDIKLENIVLMGKDSLERVKLIDFGLSCYIPSFGGMASSSGTFEYMAPIVMGNYLHRTGNAYTEKTDIWSFGVALYDFFCGELPFEYCGGQADYYLEVKGGKVRTHTRMFSSLSTPLKSVINNCLEVDEWKRPSANCLLQDYDWFQ